MFFQAKKRNLIFSWGVNIVLILTSVFSNNLALKIIFILLFITQLAVEYFSKSIYSILFIDDCYLLFRIKNNLGLIDRTFKYDLSEISYSYKNVQYKLGVRKQMEFFNGNKLIGKINEHEVEDISLDQLVEYFRLKGIVSR
ncbi:hypothetical protein L3073_00095 [Ancylomarina sp. DW003]|nr:hypothetical protein [Ancylomarina sp. DW003]MDE5420602.1 hypothetical protein [Ancylomarina sp. DW003]